ncbi:glycosyltransferase family 4 protein [Vibrio japonicus]|uniref:Glycosyltransferase family 4 protein n=1 Tax=Vibrio japonicus TaxID=1824638 RepID=A0ABY5LMA5_9VIBR|nr:glycosyltransferase family 4 protein [Vibrio japonicus]UUM32262.1 glycosyltransferase family 4 protein [Vibrio japonicus]
MKILYHHRIASKDGQYVHVEEIIRALRQLGHDVIVVGPKIAEESEFGSDGGWVSKLRKSLPKFCSELLEFCYSFYVFFKLLLAIIKHKPDAIYERYNLFLPAGIWVKKLFRLKLILEVNSPLYDERAQYGGIALKPLAKWSEVYTWRNADHVCPVTHVLAHYVIKAGVPEDHITVIPNGIDPKKFFPNQGITRNRQFEGKLTIGFVGFCREWHQLDKLLSLIAEPENNHLMLLIIGDGPAAEPLQEQAKQLGVESRFHITGLIERKDMPAWLDQIDIALQPAVTPWSSPLKLIEYLAKGKVIVAPDTDNIKELLCDNKNALLYNMDTPDAILDCIKRILSSDNLRARLQMEATKTIQDKKLTWENNAKRIEYIFSTLTSKVPVTFKETK